MLSTISTLRIGLIYPITGIRKFVTCSLHLKIQRSWNLIWYSTCRTAHAHRTKYEMDKVYLRHDGSNQDLHINFRFTNDEVHVDREFNFCRKMTEKIEDALVRIRNNIEKELSKKSKKGRKKCLSQTPETITKNYDKVCDHNCY